MDLTRRRALALGGTAVVVALMPVDFASASTEETAAAVAAFTGGAVASEGGLDLTAPEIAENGNTVPISVSAPGAKRIAIYADGNPSPGVSELSFGSMAVASASIRIRLAGTQNVVAVAEMADGSFVMSSRSVKVTIGGCGG